MSIQLSRTVEDERVSRPDAIPMMAQVYVRMRHRLRALEQELALLARDGTDEERNQSAARRRVLDDRITALQEVAERALVVPISSRAIVGSVVYVRIDEGAPLDRFEIVLPTEADPKAHRISFDSPIGKAFMGSEVGDLVTVVTPRGARVFRVMVIRHH